MSMYTKHKVVQVAKYMNIIIEIVSCIAPYRINPYDANIL